MVAKLFRRLSPRGLAYCAIGLTIILCIYYASYTSNVNQNINNQNDVRRSDILIEEPQAQVQEQDESIRHRHNTIKHQHNKNKKSILYDTCPLLTAAEADINTVDVYKDFEFQVTINYFFFLTFAKIFCFCNYFFFVALCFAFIPIKRMKFKFHLIKLLILITREEINLKQKS